MAIEVSVVIRHQYDKHLRGQGQLQNTRRNCSDRQILP
jgi:hypothetical protein